MIAIVGEAWGEEEEKQGKPFVGRSGDQLDRILAQSGIDRSQCFITNVINKRPPRNDFGVYYEDKQKKRPAPELLRAHQELRDTLYRKGFHSNQGVVVPLGNEPLFALTGQKGIESWTGSILRAEGDMKVIPTFHPSALLRMGKETGWYLPMAMHNLHRAKNEIGTSFPEPVQMELTTDPKRLERFLRETPPYVPVSIDIEVYYKYVGEEVASIAFSREPGKALVVPLLREESYEVLPDGKRKPLARFRSVRYVSEDNYIEFQRLVGWFFSSPDFMKIGQNIQFDINTLRRCGWVESFRNIYMDTLVAHANAVEPEMPHGLGFLTAWYTRTPYYKHLRDTMNESFWHYNATDAAVTLEVAQGIDKDMRRRGTYEFYHDYMSKLVPILIDLNHQGLRIDLEYQERFREGLKKKVKSVTKDLDRICEGQIENHGSSIQVATYLYAIECLPGPETWSVSVDSLERLAKKTDHPYVKRVLEHRENTGARMNWAKLKPGRDGRVRTSYTFAKTGRFRSGGGGND